MKAYKTSRLGRTASNMVSHKSAGLILLLGSVVPLTASLFSSRYVVADNLGVFSNLSGLFYVAVGMALAGLTINALSRSRNRLVHLLGLVELTIFFLAAGVVIGGPGLIATQFIGVVTNFEGANFVYTHSIQAIVPSFPEIGGWPASASFFGALLSSMGLLDSLRATEDLVMIQGMLSFINVVIFFSLAERLLGRDSNGSYAASAAFVFLGRLIPTTPNDIGFSYTLFLLMCVILFGENKRKLMPWFLVFLSISLSNFYASLMALAVSTVYSMHKRDLRFFSLGSMVMVGWLFLGLPGGYTSLARSSLLSVFNWKAIAGRLFAATSGGSYSHHLVVLSQVVLYVAMFALGIGVFLQTRLRKGPRRALGTFFISFVGLMLLVTLVVGPAFGEDPLESLQRAAYFTLPFLLGLSFASTNRRVFAVLPVVLLLATPVSLIALYGPVTNNYVGQPEMQAGQYLQNGYSPGTTILNLVPNYYSALGDTIYYLTAPNLMFSNLPMSTVNGSQLSTIEYIAGSSFLLSIGRQTSVLFHSVGNLSDYRVSVVGLSMSADLVYNSGDVQEFFK